MIWDDELEILERYSFPNRLFSSNVVLHSFVVVVVLSSLLLILSLLLFVTSKFLHGFYIILFVSFVFTCPCLLFLLLFCNFISLNRN